MTLMLLPLLGCQPSAPTGPVVLTVPGALRVAVHCGGESTVHQRGDTAEFVPEGPRCRVDAPLSPVMPLRGELEVTRAGAYRCDRVGMDLRCGPAPSR